MTIHEAVKQAEAVLREAGIQEVENDARELMLSVKNWSLTEYLTRGFGPDSKEVLSPAEEETFRELVKKRAARIPLQHILGYAYFYGYEFSVNESVLIPRFDTEILVQAVLAENREKAEDKDVLDLCTGSGCIASVLKLEGRYRRVDAADISSEALLTAEKNAEKLGAEVRFFEGDLFSALPKDPSSRYDLIVCNPPYIAESERKSLEPEVLDHDPGIALFAGMDGLDFYRRISKEAPKYLKPAGKLYFEIGASQAGEVSALLSQNGFSDIRVYRDLSGRDRVIRGIFV